MDPFQVLKTVSRTKALPLAQQLLLALLFNLIAQGSLVSSLSCYHCGELSSNARAIQDCAGVITVQQCQPDEACVVFKRLYLKGSESIRGCFPRNKNLPGLSGASITPTDNCDYSPKGRSPVKVCICTEELCNANDYNIHVDRATPIVGDGRITTGFNNSSATNAFNNARTTESSNRTSPATVALDNGARMNTVFTLTDSLHRNTNNNNNDVDNDGLVAAFEAPQPKLPPRNRVVYKVLREGLDERVEILWEQETDLDSSAVAKTGLPNELQRTPRQVVQQDFPFFGQFDQSNKNGNNNNNNFLKQIPFSPFFLGQESPFFNQVLDNRGLQFSVDGPLDCRWTDFSDWSECSVSCGDGLQTRERSIALLARRGGKPCPGESRETRACNIQKCPRGNGLRTIASQIRKIRIPELHFFVKTKKISL